MERHMVLHHRSFPIELCTFPSRAVYSTCRHMSTICSRALLTRQRTYTSGLYECKRCTKVVRRRRSFRLDAEISVRVVILSNTLFDHRWFVDASEAVQYHHRVISAWSCGAIGRKGLMNVLSKCLSLLASISSPNSLCPSSACPSWSPSACVLLRDVGLFQNRMLRRIQLHRQTQASS